MPVKAKYIKDLPLKRVLDGSESLLVQDLNGTQQAPLEVIVDEIKQNSQEKIREIESELNQTNAQLSSIGIHIKNHLNVLHCGLKNDGVTDCSRALQTLIDSCTVSGGVIYFPPGEYVIKNGIVFKSEFSNTLKLIGDDRRTTKIIFDSEDAIAFNVNGTSTNNFPKVYFENLFITNKNQNVDSIGINYNNCSTDFGVERCKITQFGVNLKIIASYTFRLNDVVSLNALSSGIQLVSCTDFKIDGGQQSGNLINISASSCYNFEITSDYSCYGNYVSEYGIYAYGCWGFSIGGYYEGYPQKNGIKLATCVGGSIENIFVSAFDTEGYAISLNDCKTCTIKNVRFSQSETGGNCVTINGSHQIKIHHCSFENIGTCIDVGLDNILTIEDCYTFGALEKYINYVDSTSNIINLRCLSTQIKKTTVNPTDAKLIIELQNVKKVGYSAELPEGYYIGQQYYTRDTKKLKIFDGADWQEIG